MERCLGNRGLSYLQVLVLLLGFLLASVVIFLFGYGVGQEMALRHTMQSERVARASIAARKPTPEPTPGVDASFYRELQEKAEKQLDATANAAVPPTQTQAPPTVTAQPPKPTATAKVATPRPTNTRRPTPPARPTSPPVPPTSAPVIGESRWSIQVITTRNAQEAIATTLELRRQGYQAFTAQAPQGNEVWYRVRVGRFGSREEAAAVERKLKQDTRFSGAYVTSQ